MFRGYFFTWTVKVTKVFCLSLYIIGPMSSASWNLGFLNVEPLLSMFKLVYSRFSASLKTPKTLHDRLHINTICLQAQDFLKLIVVYDKNDVLFQVAVLKLATSMRLLCVHYRLYSKRQCQLNG